MKGDTTRQCGSIPLLLYDQKSGMFHDCGYNWNRVHFGFRN